MSTPLLQVTDLRKEFGSVVAVDGVTLALERGGSLAIVGESGSGKTTVVRMIAGLETVTDGEILVEGEVLPPRVRGAEARRERSRQVQMVFQDPYSSLDPRQTIGEGLAEVLSLQGRGDDVTPRAMALMHQVGLDERHLDMRPTNLSGGQRQRVAIARALAVEPKVLILDEAVAALDVSIQAQILNLLNTLREQTGVSYLFVTHDLAVAQQVTETIVVMHHGRIVERGTTAEVLAAPQDEYTRQLLDAVPRHGWKPRRRIGAQSTPPIDPPK